jgi:hypothetical protein
MTQVAIMSGSTDVTGVNILWDNILARGAIYANSSPLVGPVENVADEETWDFWLPTVINAVIGVDMSSAVMCNCAAFTATANMAGKTVLVQHSNDNITFTTIASTVVIDEDGLFITFPNTTARWWLITFVGGAVPVTVGIAYLGKKLAMPNAPLSGHTAINNARKTTLMNSQTVSGQKRKNRVKRMGIETSVNFGLVATSIVDGADFVAFRDHYNSGGAFFYCGSPQEWPKDMGFCWRPESAGDINPTYVEGGELSEVSMGIVAYAG